MLLFYIAFHKGTNQSFWERISLSFLLTVAYAGLDEFHQGFTTGRTPYVGDVFLDSFGTFMALLLIVFFRQKRRRRNITH